MTALPAQLLESGQKLVVKMMKMMKLMLWWQKVLTYVCLPVSQMTYAHIFYGFLEICYVLFDVGLLFDKLFLIMFTNGLGK